jgi:DNA-binding NtrC family response regulator
MPNVILLVEDDAHSRLAFGNLLRMKGFKVVEARDAKEAVSLLSQWTIDLLITDVYLPDADGFDLVDLMRAKHPKTPLIVMSGYFSQRAGDAILQGMAHFIQKPVDTGELVETVRRLLSASNSSAREP